MAGGVALRMRVPCGLEFAMVTDRPMPTLQDRNRDLMPD
jgi:hypothetical protein